MAEWVNPDIGYQNNILRALGIGGGLGTAFGGIAGLMGKDPYKDAINQLKQSEGTYSKYYNPYLNRGEDASQSLHEMYKNLLGNPGDQYNKLAQGYQQSPGYQFALNQALQASGNEAAAGGMSGSPMAQQQAMGVAQGMASKDFQDYMNRVTGLFGAGLSGQQDESKMGWDASKSLADNLVSLQQQQAKLGIEQQQNKSNNWANIFKGAAQALPFMFMP